MVNPILLFENRHLVTSPLGFKALVVVPKTFAAFTYFAFLETPLPSVFTNLQQISAAAL